MREAAPKEPTEGERDVSTTEDGSDVTEGSQPTSKRLTGPKETDGDEATQTEDSEKNADTPEKKGKLIEKKEQGAYIQRTERH